MARIVNKGNIAGLSRVPESTRWPFGQFPRCFQWAQEDSDLRPRPYQGREPRSPTSHLQASPPVRSEDHGRLSGHRVAEAIHGDATRSLTRVGDWHNEATQAGVYTKSAGGFAVARSNDLVARPFCGEYRDFAGLYRARR